MWYPAVLLVATCFFGLAASEPLGDKVLLGVRTYYKVMNRNMVDSPQASITEPSKMGWVIAVAMKPYIFLSSAALKYRHVTDPLEEQISYMGFENNEVIVHPGYGFLTFANNIAITKGDKHFKHFAKVKKGYPREIGKELVSYFIIGTDAMEPDDKQLKIKIVDFAKCQEAFGSYNLDENEQICTEVYFKGTSMEKEISPAVLIDESNEGESLFVGITSISNDKYTVSTFVPYHCDHPLLAIHDICSE